MLKVDNTEIKLQKPIVDLVADIIRRKIVNGEIKHNLKLSTRQLSEELEISRTPVREAIRRLESEGLIELLPRKGFVVKE
ncbi:MAG: GntR family transcriptional regulator, partial [Bacteroidetes bacterium CG23_combo_of_CG06-09_8_20_14_all_32_9]